MSLSKENIIDLVKKTSKKIAPQYGLDSSLLAQTATAIIWKESRFKPDAENKNSTARGLFQVLITTQRETEKKRAKVPFAVAKHKSSAFPSAPVGKEDKMFEPEYNILIGMHYLAYQLKRYGELGKAIHAYNQGSYPGNWKFDGIQYADSVQKYISENLPISEFKSSNPIAKVIEKLKPKKKTTVRVGKIRFIRKATGAFY